MAVAASPPCRRSTGGTVLGVGRVVRRRQRCCPSARGGLLHQVGKGLNTKGFGPCAETTTKFISLVVLVAGV